MNPETFNLSVRKFLKVVGVTSQREIEQAVARAIESGAIDGTQPLAATMTLEVPALNLRLTIPADVELG
ncbi:MAG: DUF6494 family protein [Rubrivivax sp.]